MFAISWLSFCFIFDPKHRFISTLPTNTNELNLMYYKLVFVMITFLYRGLQTTFFLRVKVNDRQPIGEGGGSRAAEPQKFLRIRGWLQTCRRVETAGAMKLLDGYLPRGRTCPRQFQTYFNIHISPVLSPRVRAPLNRRLRIPFAA